MYILGISAFYHDSAASLLKDGEIIAAAQEERFTRKKHDAGFPTHAIQYCLKEAGIAAKDIDNVVFYEKPFVKFERLLETYLAFAPKGFTSFAKAMPVLKFRSLELLSDYLGSSFTSYQLDLYKNLIKEFYQTSLDRGEVPVVLYMRDDRRSFLTAGFFK